MSSERNLKHTTNIFDASEYDEAFWKTYLKARPKYSSDFYQLVLDYHHGSDSSSTNDGAGGSFSSSPSRLAHDIGSGPGQVAAFLSEHFEHVVASDKEAAHLAVAQHRLADLFAAQKLTFEIAGGEDIASKYPLADADLVAVAECLPLMNVPVAMDNFHALLRPGGTLAIWFYGRPAFAEDEYADRCQEVFGRIVNEEMGRTIRHFSPARKVGLTSGLGHMMTSLDDVEFPEEQWTDVERRKWNPDKVMTFVDDSACGITAPLVSRVGKSEKLTQTIDRGFWPEKWNVADIMDFVSVNVPGNRPANYVMDAEVKAMYEELEAAMGGEGATRDITWPVVLILARKR